MYLIEIFLPTADNQGRPFSGAILAGVREELIDRFGGITVFARVPADGATKEGEEVVKDRIIVVEVMTNALDETWWTSYREALEKLFVQDEILIRATAIRRL